MKKIILFSFLFLIGTSFAHAVDGYKRGDPLAYPTYEDNGDIPDILYVRVGSTTPSSLYDVARSSRIGEIRLVTVKNMSSNYDLKIGSWSGFDVTSQAWSVDRASGTWSTSNKFNQFWKYDPGSSSDTIRVIVEVKHP